MLGNSVDDKIADGVSVLLCEVPGGDCGVYFRLLEDVVLGQGVELIPLPGH